MQDENSKNIIPIPHNSCSFSRAEEKEQSRQEDLKLIEQGIKTAEQVRKENTAFAFKDVQLILPLPKKKV